MDHGVHTLVLDPPDQERIQQAGGSIREVGRKAPKAEYGGPFFRFSLLVQIDTDKIIHALHGEVQHGCRYNSPVGNDLTDPKQPDDQDHTQEEKILPGG